MVFTESESRAWTPSCDLLSRRVRTSVSCGTDDSSSAARPQTAETSRRTVFWRDGDWRCEPSLPERELGQRSFAIASCLTGSTPERYPAGCQQGLRAQFDLAAASPNGFRARTATLDCATDDCARTLLIVVSAQVAGTEQFAQVTLRRGAETTMDLHSPPAHALIGRRRLPGLARTISLLLAVHPGSLLSPREPAENSRRGGFPRDARRWSGL